MLGSKLLPGSCAILLWIVLASCLFGQAQPQAPVGLAVRPDYILGSNDQILIRSAQVAEISDRPFRIDTDGFIELPLVGRIKELIIRGGENIAPAEVEDVLLTHPAVTDAVCFGIPDEKYGEQVAVAVSLSLDVGEETLLGLCRERLTAVKVPSVIHILEAIPRTPTGKLQRRRVAAAIYGDE